MCRIEKKEMINGKELRTIIKDDMGYFMISDLYNIIGCNSDIREAKGIEYFENYNPEADIDSRRYHDEVMNETFASYTIMTMGDISDIEREELLKILRLYKHDMSKGEGENYYCINSGRKFRTQSEIVKFYGLNANSLSLHLNGKKSFVWVWYEYPEYHGVKYYFERL